MALFITLIFSFFMVLVMPLQAVADTQDRIVIVGAGVAGLSAAADLRARGYQHVILLEARERIGGRIWTDSMGAALGKDIPIDLGASWIHGIDGNPITEIADQQGFDYRITDDDKSILYDSQGHLKPDRRALSRHFFAYARTRPDDPLQEVLDAYVVAEKPDSPTRAYLRYLLSSVVEHELARSIKDVSLKSLTELDGFDGPDAILNRGYSQITDHLAKGLDIRLNSPVSQIEYGEGGVRLMVQDGSVYQADKVIVTVPLGVLKKKLIRFIPELPPEKQQVIHTLGMGVLNKAYLLFDHVFWEKGAEFIGFISEKDGEWTESLNLYPYTGAPLLLMFNAGEFGAAIEALSDEELTAEAMKILKRLYGPDIPKPVEVVITRWNSDQWSYGSYSYVPAGASYQLYRKLGEPVGEYLFFAGEATHEAYPATVHGAYLSGQRAAAEVAGEE